MNNAEGNPHLSPQDRAGPTLGRRLAVASVYAVLQRLILRGIGLISTVILARLLVPEDFGIVAVAAIIHTFLEVLSTTSFHLALVRMRTPTPEHYDTVFTMNLIRGALIAAGLIGLAGPQADLMGDARVANVMRLLALSVALQSLHSVRMADFQRDLRFDRILKFTVIGKIVLFAISIPLAFCLRNYWALVVGNPISQIVLIPVSYAMAPYRPRIKLDHWREFINFSKWLLFGNICSLLDGQLMNIVIGRLEGMSAVGLYQLAYQIAALPVSEIAAPLRGPAYAGFARLQGKPPAMRWQFRATLEMQWMVILPLSVGIALTAHEITSLFLGAHWVGLTPIMPLVAGAALLDALGHFTHGLQIVLNSQRRMVLVWFATILVRVPLVALGTAQYGLVGAMVALVGTGLVNALVWLSQAGSLIGLSLPNCLAPLWRSSTAAAAMTGVVLFVPAHWFANSALLQDGFSLLIKAGAGAATYCGALAALWWLSGMPDRSAEAEILRLLHRLTHRLGLLSQR